MLSTLQAESLNGAILEKGSSSSRVSRLTGASSKWKGMKSSPSATSRLRRSREVAEGELFMPFHYGEAPVNRLTRDELDPYSKIAPFKLSACRVER